MTCYYPIHGWRSRAGKSPNGAWPVVFNASEGLLDMPVAVPCGRCIGCRIDRGRYWAARCVEEARLWPNNWFITLTYRDLPPDGSLVPKDLTDFWKRLRKEVFKTRDPVYEYVDGRKSVVNGVRYMACGEYGDSGKRPHYHAICFNLDIPDLEPFGRNRNGDQLWTSKWLESIWSHGFVTVGAVTFESAAYVAGYVLKKMTGEKAEEHYQGRVPEFLRCSNRPGIGLGWFLKYSDEVARLGYVMIDGRKCSVPRYYMEKLKTFDHDAYLRIKRHSAIISKRSQGSLDRTPERMHDRCKAVEYRYSKFKRDSA